MRLSELDYDLPEELIAQEPLARRDEARLLVLDRKTKSLEHSRFYKLVRHLREGDLIVLNDTRVLPARLFAQKESGGRVELLMVRPAAPSEGPAGAWIALIRTHRVLKDNARLILGDGHALKIAGYARPGRPIVVAEGESSIEQILNRAGTLALPHYIHRTVAAADLDDYQTVYAARPGAIAAPTAGLHFTDESFKALADAGIRTAA
ncbi:MAG TPA: S-adenosylmethionine:tRNA ribosyltransferase-isomerase, partial [Candidatus Acidoferrum sp.]|nr:S-adenosylmethionine:tRNA ribosyltransferase-isomerase [Candidatus Acidoferrum sp.]